MMSIPSQVSDAGPDEKPASRATQFLYAMDDASDHVRDAGRLFRDSLIAQTKLRQELIDAAIEALQLARVVA